MLTILRSGLNHFYHFHKKLHSRYFGEQWFDFLVDNTSRPDSFSSNEAVNNGNCSKNSLWKQSDTHRLIWCLQYIIMIMGWLFSERLTAMAQATYPCFSRGLILPHTWMNTAMYHGIAPRRKPVINLEEITNQAIQPKCVLKTKWLSFEMLTKLTRTNRFQDHNKEELLLLQVFLQQQQGILKFSFI